MAGKLLSCLGRLFTSYLQTRGFTLGVADILVTEKVRRLMDGGSHLQKIAYDPCSNYKQYTIAMHHVLLSPCIILNQLFLVLSG